MICTKTIARLYLIRLKMEKCWDLMHYVCSCIGGIPLFITRVQMHTSIRQAKYYYVLPNIVVTVTNSNECPAKVELPEKARPTRKGAQRCANCLLSPYSHIWVVCSVYGTHPSCSIRIVSSEKQTHMIGPVIAFCMFLLHNPDRGSLTEYSRNTQATCYYIFR